MSLRTAASRFLPSGAGGLPSAFETCNLASCLDVTRRFMSKYLSKSATKRLPLTTKRVRKGYYKGKGGTKEGYFIKGGKYRLDKTKMLELMIPDLTGFKLKPYIAASVSKIPPEWRNTPS